MMKSKVFINQFGVIEYIVVGDMTSDSVNLLIDRGTTIANKLRSEGKPVAMLDNLYALGTATPSARKTMVERVKALDYDKLAFTSKDRYIRFAANLVFQAIGRGESVKFFEEYDKANRWLTS